MLRLKLHSTFTSVPFRSVKMKLIFLLKSMSQPISHLCFRTSLGYLHLTAVSLTDRLILTVLSLLNKLHSVQLRRLSKGSVTRDTFKHINRSVD